MIRQNNGKQLTLIIQKRLKVNTRNNNTIIIAKIFTLTNVKSNLGNIKKKIIIVNKYFYEK